MSTRAELLASIATTTKDYRAGEIAEPTPEHVDQWVNQFDAEVQEPILAEMDHVLKKTYLNRNSVKRFLSGLVTLKKLAGDNPCAFWRSVKFLKIQRAGHSQQDMLALFDGFLREHCGVAVDECGKDSATFVYLDDAIFTGNRVLKDFSAWLLTTAPAKSKVNVITIANHRGGIYYATGRIEEAAAKCNKQIELEWWRQAELEDTKYRTNNSDVLRPRSLGDDPKVAAYAAELKFPPSFRTQDGIGEHKFFSSEAGRALLEQEFLKAGVRIRELCPNLQKFQRPLGNTVLETLGFGTTLVTYRNCPNNAPLAIWAGDPWYPLFARKNN